MRTELESIAAQYAQALFELCEASAPAAEDTVLSDLEAVNQVVAATPDFNVVLGHPAVGGQTKKQMLVDLFAGKVSDLTLRLLELLADKRRLNLLRLIEPAFRRLVRERKNIAEAALVSADQLTDGEIEKIKSRLSARIGKTVELSVTVDKSLIGGVVLRLGDQVIDGSLRGKLETLKKALLSV